MRKILEAGLWPDKLTVNNVDFVKAGMCPTCSSRPLWSPRHLARQDLHGDCQEHGGEREMKNRMTTETGRVSPAEVKAMWLERKLASLKPAIAGEGKDNAMKWNMELSICVFWWASATLGRSLFLETGGPILAKDRTKSYIPVDQSESSQHQRDHCVRAIDDINWRHPHASLKNYQPGGMGERATWLKELIDPKYGKNFVGNSFNLEVMETGLQENGRN